MMLPPSVPCADDREVHRSARTACVFPSRRGFIGRIRGFSLVEVALAMGLCTFALLSLLSLMPVSLGSAKKAMEITRIDKAFQRVSAELTQSKFENLAVMTDNKWYFDYDGNAASAADKFFTVRAAIAPSPVANQASVSLLRVKLEAQTLQDAYAGSATITVCDMGY